MGLLGMGMSLMPLREVKRNEIPAARPAGFQRSEFKGNGKNPFSGALKVQLPPGMSQFVTWASQVSENPPEIPISCSLLLGEHSA